VSLIEQTAIHDFFDVDSVPPGSVATVAKRFGFSPDGASATYPLIVVAGREPGPAACLIAGIHGDEYEGPAALWRVLEQLDPGKLRGRVAAVPVAHGAAFAAATRSSPIDGVNLARSFPGDPNGTITQRLAYDLFQTVVRSADILVDLHSGGTRLAFVQVAGFYGPGDGFADELAARSLGLAQAMGLPWIWRLPPRAGVLSFEAACAGIAVTGCEAGGRGGCLEGDVAAYARGVLGVLADQGLIERPANLPPPPDYTHFLDGDFAPAPVSGFLEPVAALGERLCTGGLLARIRATTGTELARLLADMDCVVMAERHLRTINAGEWATCAVRERPL
jgi:predicted deacylase